MTTGINNQNKQNMDKNNEFRAVIGERNICTSYYAGTLQGTLRTLCWRDAPGLTISDAPAFRAWVERELESCMVEAEIYQKTKDKPVDTKPMV